MDYAAKASALADAYRKALAYLRAVRDENDMDAEIIYSGMTSRETLYFATALAQLAVKTGTVTDEWLTENLGGIARQECDGSLMAIVSSRA